MVCDTHHMFAIPIICFLIVSQGRVGEGQKSRCRKVRRKGGRKGGMSKLGLGEMQRKGLLKGGRRVKEE